MGAGASSKMAGYHVLRASIPGCLLSEEDFEQFYLHCKVETTEADSNTLSTMLHPPKSQLFYVVITGEVLINVKLHGCDRTLTLVNFRAGETIQFLKSGLNDSGTCVYIGGIQVHQYLLCSSSTVPGRVVGMDESAFRKFQSAATGSTHALASLLALSMESYPTSSAFFQSLTPEQVCFTYLLYSIAVTYSTYSPVLIYHFLFLCLGPIDSRVQFVHESEAFTRGRSGSDATPPTTADAPPPRTWSVR